MPQPIRAEQIIGKFDMSWHEVGATGEPAYANGWTTTTGKHFGFRYVPGIDCVHIHGRITPGTETNGTIVFTLPDKLWPESVYSYIGVTDTAGSAGGRFYISDTGDFRVLDLDTAGTFYDINILMPLGV